MNKSAKLYRNEDEVDRENYQFDYTLILPERKLVLEIGSIEASVWRGLRSGKLLAEVVADVSVISGKFEQARIERLVEEWQELGLVRPPISKFAEEKKPWYRKLIWTEVESPKLTNLFEVWYSKVAKHFFKLWGVGILFGLVLFASTIATFLHINGGINSISFVDTNFAVVMILMLASLALHELGHATAMVWAKAEIIRTGFAFYFGLPLLFVDTSTIWAKTRYKRLVVATAGMVVNLTIASTAMIAMIFIRDQTIASYLWELILLNIFHIAVSLLPFIKMDGYYILVDIIGIPNLQQKAFNEVDQVLHHPNRYDFSKRQSMMLAFGGLSTISSVGIGLYAIYYWVNILGIL